MYFLSHNSIAHFAYEINVFFDMQLRIVLFFTIFKIFFTLFFVFSSVIISWKNKGV